MTTHTADRNAEATEIVATAIRDYYTTEALMGGSPQEALDRWHDGMMAVVRPMLAIAIALIGDKYDGLEMEERDEAMYPDLVLFLLTAGFPSEAVALISREHPEAIL